MSSMKRQLAKRKTLGLTCILSSSGLEDTRNYQGARESLRNGHKAFLFSSETVQEDPVAEEVEFVFTKERRAVRPAPSKMVDEVIALKADDSSGVQMGNQAESREERRRSGIRPNPRRSSVALLRGKRASSVIGGNLVSPHPSVSCADFHTLISTELPGPHRMRQLFIWVFQDLLREDAPQDLTEDELVLRKEMLEKTIKGLVNKDVTTSWYQRPIDPAESTRETRPLQKALLPNPRNEEIKDALQSYEAFRAKVNADKKVWDELLEKARNIQSDECVDEAEALAEMDPDAQKFLRITEQETQKSLALLKDQHDWLTCFQFKADLVSNALSTSSHFEKHSKHYCENLFKSIYYKFILEKERRVPGALTTRKMDTLQLLRALSRVS
jgi:hypothetical protein